MSRCEGKRARVFVPIVTVLCLFCLHQLYQQGDGLTAARVALNAKDAQEVTTDATTDAQEVSEVSEASEIIRQPVLASDSAFAKIASHAFTEAAAPQQRPRPVFDLNGWEKTDGGLSDKDRVMLADIYRNANSVFEYGLGESTKIAGFVGVPRYSGIDSDPVWVAKARENSPSHFRFYFADIGKTGDWGYPAETLQKNVYNYQLSPLMAELSPFDVYMVDGRWRLSSLVASFLHASARGANPADTIVLLHDCVIKGVTNPAKYYAANRPQYRLADHLLDLIRFSGDSLCAYKRKNSTSDDELIEIWYKNSDFTL